MASKESYMYIKYTLHLNALPWIKIQGGTWFLYILLSCDNTLEGSSEFICNASTYHFKQGGKLNKSIVATVPLVKLSTLSISGCESLLVKCQKNKINI